MIWMRRVRTWSIITPEFPPAAGGIGDYTELVARRLVDRGDAVTIFTCSPPERTPIPGAEIVCIPDEFGAATRRMLARHFAATPDGVTFVQYVPQGFRQRGMNVRFCGWLGARPERRFVMVHEAVYPVMAGDSAHRLLLAGATRLMLRLVLRGSERVFISTPAWEEALERWGGALRSLEWLPIPATLSPDPASLVSSAQPPPESSPVLAHFGTYGSFMPVLLEPILAAAVETRADLKLLLLGRGAQDFARAFVERHPAARGRVDLAGSAPVEIADALARATVVVLPFGEGVTTRRTSLMNALAVGAALVTTDGELSERFWRESGAVALYRYDEPGAAIREIERLIDDQAARSKQKNAARALYRARFDLEHVVDRLQSLYDVGVHDTRTT